MENLREVLQEAQKRGLFDSGQTEVERRMGEVDRTDIRRLAKLIDGWQRRCVAQAEKPYDELVAIDNPEGISVMLGAARTRGLISVRTLGVELLQFTKKTERRQFLGTKDTKDFDMNQ